MRNRLISSLILFAMIIIATQCKSTQETTMEMPGTVQKALYRSTPTQHTVSFKIITDATLQMDSIYFKSGSAKLEEIPSANGKAYTAAIDRMNLDLIMDIDPRKEAKNKLGGSQNDKLPIAIKGEEGLVSYKENGETKYFKIDKFKKEAKATK